MPNNKLKIVLLNNPNKFKSNKAANKENHNMENYLIKMNLLTRDFFYLFNSQQSS